VDIVAGILRKALFFIGSTVSQKEAEKQNKKDLCSLDTQSKSV
jgi:hypothetical protein